MPDLNDMAIFAQVVEARSFSAAAQRMDASKSRVSKSVARLERAVGARLLNRSTRRLSLTEAGEAFHAHCRRMLDEALLARQAVSRHQAAPHGVIKVAAPVTFGTLRLAPALPEFLVRHPQVGIDLSLSDRALDFVAEGLDLALVVGGKVVPGLAGRRIAALRRVLCAAPGYLRARGVPACPGDLVRHNCLHATGAWSLGGRAIAVAGSLRTSDDKALWTAARGGLGIALLPEFLAQEDLRCGRLVAVLPDYPAAEEALYALRMPGLHVAPKVRALLDFLCLRFGRVVEDAHGQDPGAGRRLEVLRSGGQARRRPAGERDEAAGAAGERAARMGAGAL